MIERTFILKTDYLNSPINHIWRFADRLPDLTALVVSHLKRWWRDYAFRNVVCRSVACVKDTRPRVEFRAVWVHASDCQLMHVRRGSHVCTTPLLPTLGGPPLPKFCFGKGTQASGSPRAVRDESLSPQVP
ncbi:hypothetical protein J6590_009709 [Homalodisca vitripennis]|nr:hypothetical protein J6590_009709 [Homalodisca vitripennis]